MSLLNALFTPSEPAVRDDKALIEENKQELRTAKHQVMHEKRKAELKQRRLAVELCNLGRQPGITRQKLRPKAEDLSRVETNISNCDHMVSQFESLETTFSQATTMQALANGMRSASRVLGRMNRNLNLEGVSKLSMRFQMQTERFKDKMEQLNEGMNEAMALGDEETKEVDSRVEQVLDRYTLAQMEAAPASVDKQFADLDARLAALKEPGMH